MTGFGAGHLVRASSRRADRSSFAIVLALLALLPTVSAAQAAQADTTKPEPHVAQPERPTVATHAGTVAPGWLEIEAGAERDRRGATTLLTPTTFKFGLAPRLQLELAGSFITTSAPGVPRQSGAGDVTVNLKWRLVDDAPVVGDFAILPALKLPAGSADRGTGTGTTDVSLLLISSHDIGGIALDLNAGVTRRSGDGTLAPRTATLWTVSTGGPIAGRLGFAAELFGLPGTAGVAGSDPIVSLLVGPTFTAAGWLVFDAGIIAGLAGPQPHAVYAGVTWNVGRLW